jgi:hypothetical protein
MKPTAADRRRADAYAPFAGRLPVKRAGRAVSVWTRPLVVVPVNALNPQPQKVSQ